MKRLLACFLVFASFLCAVEPVHRDQKQPYVETRGDGEPIVIDSEIRILTWNILGFHKEQTDREKRPHFLDPVKDYKTRLDAISEVIKKNKPDVLLLQEVHDEPSDIDKKIVQSLDDDFYVFYTHILRNTELTHGSGLLVATRYKNTSFDAFVFKNKGGVDRTYVNKGFGILSIRNDNGMLIMRVVDTHLQSGNSKRQDAIDDQGNTLSCSEIRDLQIREIVAKLRELDALEPAEVNVIGGDLNVNRNDIVDLYPGGRMALLHPDNPALQHGFSKQLSPYDNTQQDIGEEPEAVDNIVALPGPHTIVTEQITSYAKYDDPSDHGALMATIHLKAE